MVKTRHSGDIDTESPPTFISLANEKNRHSLKSDDPSSGGGGQSDRTYAHRDAYNIFEEKVVESRLRPRIGPSRAYNYIDVDSSDEEIIRRHRHLPIHGYSSERLRAKYSRSLEIKHEMVEKEERPRRMLHRQSSPQEDTEDQSTEEEDEDRHESTLRRQHSGSVDDKNSRAGSRRRIQLALNERKENESARSLRNRQRQSENADNARTHKLQQGPTTEDDEEHLIRRSSRTRRQIYDTLNQSYLVSVPGRTQNDSGDNNDHSDTKDQDSDDNQEFSDMYSRVKRKRVRVKRNMYGVPVSDDSDSEQDVAKDNKNSNNKDDDDDENEDDDATDNRQATKRRNRSLDKKRPEMVKSYSLREHKPRTVLYKAPVEESRRIKRIHVSLFPGSQNKKMTNQAYCSPAQKRNIRKRSAIHSSSGSTTSDSESSDEKNFNRRKAKSMNRARRRMMPLNCNTSALPAANIIKDRVRAGASLADIEPMTIDRSVTFKSIGGLEKHIRSLKEMVVFPLLYKQVFQRFKVDPPRGVLFYGPPGTGKTLVARALANECSHGDKRVAFFMRKGADCLSKWVGESERQLRLLFDQAYKFRPSIIFFDEIDGLAPVRSSRQDQIHSSIVSTLLALMDGLDSRGEIVVIGATNRIDSLDPALRRPGRFDREFLFHLPSYEARRQILKIHTSGWAPQLNDDFLSELAEKCVGFCGADLKALCTEAAMMALRRRYPQIYNTDDIYELDVASIKVSAKDFFDAVNNVVPTSQRTVNSPARALPARVSPLLQQLLDRVMNQLCDIFPLCHAVTSTQVQAVSQDGFMWDELPSDEDENAPSIFVQTTSGKGSKSNRLSSTDEQSNNARPSPLYLSFNSSAASRPATFRPRMILTGREGQGQSTYIAPAIIHKLENMPVHVLDLPTLYAVTAKTPEESCANVFHEARLKCPSIIYMPYINQWWDVMGETLKGALLTLIRNLDPSLPLLLLATSEQPYNTLDPVLQSLFSQMSGEVAYMTDPTTEERRAFFQDLLLRQATLPPPQKKQAEVHLLPKVKRTIRRSQKRSCTAKREKLAYSYACDLLSPDDDAIYAENRNDLHTHDDVAYNCGRKYLSPSTTYASDSSSYVQPKRKRRQSSHSYSRSRSKVKRRRRKSPVKAVRRTVRPKKAVKSVRKTVTRPPKATVKSVYKTATQQPRTTCHCMQLRPRKNNPRLNSNQSARCSEPQPGPSVIRKSKKSASWDRKLRTYDIPAKHVRHGSSTTHERTTHTKTRSRLYCGTHQMLYKHSRHSGSKSHARETLPLPMNLNNLYPHIHFNGKRNSLRTTKSAHSPRDRLKIRRCPRCSLWSRQVWRQNSQRMLETLPKAAPPKPRELTEEELALLVEKEELTLMELRIFLRDVLNKLGSDKKFSIFAKPVNIEDAADYYDIISNPMDLSTMMAKIDIHQYTTVRSFMQDIDLICSNALEYNPNRGPMDRIIRHRACALKDTAYAIIKTDLDKEFEKTCIEIEESRKRRGEKSTTVPNFYYTKPANQQMPKSQTVTPSYLDSQRPPRSIPKPEGERFSRRVRGMNIDPAPPLEAVEKVYKLSRSNDSTAQENKNNHNSESETVVSQRHASVNSEGETANNSRPLIPSNTSPSKEEKVVRPGDNKVCEEKKHVQSVTSSGTKRKRNKCVWCIPRRKRPKVFSSKSPANLASGDEGAEDEMSHEECEGEKQVLPRVETSHLVVDVTEQEESKDMRSPERISTRSRSPGHVSPAASCSRVSTRSSLSPSLVQCPHRNSSNQSHITSGQSESTKGSESSVLPHCLHSESKGEAIDKIMTDSSCRQSETLVQPSSLVMEPPVRPKVLKRLDLESVTVDSGVGSSVDSNGDSRDSMDHKGEGEQGAKTLCAAEDFNQNCTAGVKQPAQKVVVVDDARLHALLNHLVLASDGSTVEHMEKIYSHLSQIIFRHRHDYDKSALVNELEQKVDELTRI